MLNNCIVRLFLPVIIYAGIVGSVLLPALTSTYIGCYLWDNSYTDASNLVMMVDETSMTNDRCFKFCSSLNHAYASTMNG